MKVCIIAAVARNGVIGAGGRLPWKLPADLARFKALTLGKPVIMGRRTWQSLGRALPGRRNIVITHEGDRFWARGATVVCHPTAALAAAAGAEEAMIIGGSSVYAFFLPLADRIYLTRVDAEPQGDAFFPELDLSRWRETLREEHPIDERHACAYAFLTYELARQSR